MAYWQLIPFYPTFIKSHNVDEVVVGYVMSAFATSTIIMAPITGNFLLKHM